jgi:hypothetical protein
MGKPSHSASAAEVGVQVRGYLEEHGLLESFFVGPTSKGKREKATAWFQEEADARAACSLNNKSLEILGTGRLTVTLVQSVKIKIPVAVYRASKSRIDQAVECWRERHLAFHEYPDAFGRYTTLKVQGDDTKEMAHARKTLDEISNGTILRDGDNANAIWGPALGGNGSAYKTLKSIEKELHVVIVRDKSKRQLQYYGPPETLPQVVRQIKDMLDEEPSASYEIPLKPPQFSWAIQGGFKSIEQALGKSVAVFDVVSRTITIKGTQQQYETALAIMDGKTVAADTVGGRPRSHRAPSELDGDCPICFCKADAPIQTSCNHTYCLECFEDCCKAAASTSKDDFQVQCQGDEGKCPTTFTLRELRDHLSSSVFERVLQSSFEEYVQRHPDEFHYCPTPDCGYVYRCGRADAGSSSSSRPPPYTCPNCLEPICTVCHARHGEYSCAEYKDIASGGHEALAALKKKLNIKDCPKCTTPMEKTEGCNHMTCGGCRAHICWVCMAVFTASGPCYDHMNQMHGGIGLGLERFMMW